MQFHMFTREKKNQLTIVNWSAFVRLNIDLVGLKSKTKKITCSKSNIKRRSCSTSADWTNNYLKSRVCMYIICANFNQPFCFSLLSLWHKTTKKNRELYTHSVFFWHDNGTNRVFEQSECMTHYHEMTIPIARMYYKRKKIRTIPFIFPVSCSSYGSRA